MPWCHFDPGVWMIKMITTIQQLLFASTWPCWRRRRFVFHISSVNFGRASRLKKKVSLTSLCKYLNRRMISPFGALALDFVMQHYALFTPPQVDYCCLEWSNKKCCYLRPNEETRFFEGRETLYSSSFWMPNRTSFPLNIHWLWDGNHLRLLWLVNELLICWFT